MRSIVRRDTGETYQEFLTQLAQASGIETPTRDGPGAHRSEAHEEGVERRLDPSARSRREDHEDEGQRTHLAHKAEHAVDLETGAVVAVTVQDADEGDTTTSIETLIEAAEQVETVVPDGEGIEEVVARQGLSQQPGDGGSRSGRRAELHLGT